MARGDVSLRQIRQQTLSVHNCASLVTTELSLGTQGLSEAARFCKPCGAAVVTEV